MAKLPSAGFPIGPQSLAGTFLLSALVTGCATAPAPAPVPQPFEPQPLGAAAPRPTSYQRYRVGRITRPGPTQFRESEIYDTPFTFDTHLGIRALNDDEGWGDLDRQAELGVSFLVPVILDDIAAIEDTRTGFLSLLSYDFGLRYAFDSSETRDGTGVVQRLESQTFDVQLGLLLSPFQFTSRFQPYVGAGVAFAFVDSDLNFSGTVQSDRDSVLTSYARTGARLMLDYGRHAGIDVRWLNNADVSIDGLGADIGALSVSLTFGASF